MISPFYNQVIYDEDDISMWTRKTPRAIEIGESEFSSVEDFIWRLNVTQMKNGVNSSSSMVVSSSTNWMDILWIILLMKWHVRIVMGKLSTVHFQPICPILFVSQLINYWSLQWTVIKVNHNVIKFQLLHQHQQIWKF